MVCISTTFGSHLLFFLMYLSSFRLMRYTTGFPLMHGLLFSQSVSFTFQSPNLHRQLPDSGIISTLQNMCINTAEQAIKTGLQSAGKLSMLYLRHCMTTHHNLRQVTCDAGQYGYAYAYAWQSRAEQSRAEQSRAEQSRAERVCQS